MKVSQASRSVQESACPPRGPLLGAHMSIAGGIPLAVERANQAGCNVLQIFVKNNHRWKGKILSEAEVSQFRKACSDSQIRSVVAHDSYLINFAVPGEKLWHLSIQAFIEEMERCHRLGLSYLVAHPGSHVGEGEERGIDRIARAIDRIHEQTRGYGVRIALETVAGQGTSIGYRFQHLRDILGSCRHPEKVSICLDTCHVFAAGYDLRSRESYRRMMKEFDRIIGLDKLCLFHFNDSKRELGSRVDRHEQIGTGKIGVAGFRWILEDRRFVGLPKIIETPKGKTHREDRRNLRILRSLAQSMAVDQ